MSAQPELKTLEDTKDGKTRWIELRIPVTEGTRYRIGELVVRGQQAVSRAKRCGTLYKVEAGRVVQPQEDSTTGTRRRRKSTASRGYMEFTPFPMFKYQRRPDQSRDGAGRAGARRRSPCRAETNGTQGQAETSKPPVVDVRCGSPKGAVLRQPHHLHRQHDDARQRDPPRDAADRRQRLRHRGAEVQRPPAESARLLQGA